MSDRLHDSEPASVKRLRRSAGNLPGRGSRAAQKRRREEEQQRLREERRHAFHFDENDSLSLTDAYRMNGSVFSSPVYNIGMALFLAGMVFATPWAFDFEEAVEAFVPWDWPTFVALIALFHLAAVAINLFAALITLARMRRLPFAVNGLGILAHRIHHRRFFRKCTVRIELKEDRGVPAETLREVECTVARLIAHRANRVMARRGLPEWKAGQGTVSGHASWKIVRGIVRVLEHDLRPVHKELGIVAAVVFETPKGRLPDSDYIEWQSEGD